MKTGDEDRTKKRPIFQGTCGHGEFLGTRAQKQSSPPHKKDIAPSPTVFFSLLLFMRKGHGKNPHPSSPRPRHCPPLQRSSSPPTQITKISELCKRELSTRKPACTSIPSGAHDSSQPPRETGPTSSHSRPFQPDGGVPAALSHTLFSGIPSSPETF